MGDKIKEIIEKMTIILCVTLFVVVLMGGQWSGVPEMVPLDMGPKPSLTVNILAQGEYTVYGTFLTEGEAPPDGNSSNAIDNQAILEKFRSYQDRDGWKVIMGYLQECSRGRAYTLSDSYSPPYRFKILIYVPEQDVFLATQQVYERYYFYSKYTLNLTGYDLEKYRGQTVFVDEQMYSHQAEDRARSIRDIIFRVGATILIEWWIAVVFFEIKGLRNTLWIILVNIVTQTFLNIYVLKESMGAAFLLYLPVGELIVFAVEALLYMIFLRWYEKSIGKVIAYSFMANLVTAITGVWLSVYFPAVLFS